MSGELVGEVFQDVHHVRLDVVDTDQFRGHTVLALECPVEPPSNSQPFDEMLLDLERKEGRFSIQNTAYQLYTQNGGTFSHLKILIWIHRYFPTNGMRKTAEMLSLRVETLSDYTLERRLADNVSGASARVGDSLVSLEVAQDKLLFHLLVGEKVTEVVHHDEGVVICLQQIVKLVLVLVICCHGPGLHFVPQMLPPGHCRELLYPELLWSVGPLLLVRYEDQAGAVGAPSSCQVNGLALIVLWRGQHHAEDTRPVGGGPAGRDLLRRKVWVLRSTALIVPDDQEDQDDVQGTGQGSRFLFYHIPNIPSMIT